ncbi:cytochrome bd-type quinol oxidase, subunit 1 [Frankia sp. CcI6]|uniref:cytochrome ubiquinol oxidase subunit I n=1 Tax=unclassified Frankia TaxID=2632575 RepID=UPI0003CFD394|nr:MULTISPECIES: cytochrome ubiquinol oxidase subunit I [unclassified Frankia]ETA03651.1 cytochrome bd-type quinol oxidase, subunit 1 [Frankia sp. CcI6]KFB05302.1 cytochrome bd-I ubiquinol oxidase subunit 1 apoprotein [Frankia sp. Allo2]
MVLAADAVDLARAQTAFSLAFHICFAVFGVGMPWLLIYTEGRWVRTGDETWLALTKKWSRAFAVLFAVGAVSGTVLSFEFGLLWPAFMSKYGSALGLSFSLEGFAFFTEAIFVGMYLYGWKRLSPRAHWLTLWPIAISGTLSTLFIITVNAWMNVPRGITEVNGKVVAAEPFAPFLSPGTPPQVVHMLLAALMCTGGAVSSIYAVGMLRGRRDAYHQRGLRIGLAVVLVCAPLQLIVGDWAARIAGANQPFKLAAMEGLYHTRSHAPLTLGGFYDDKSGEVRYGLEIPGLLSLMEGFSTDHVITGLDAAPPDERPNGLLVHGSFATMVGFGSALIGLSALTGAAVVRRRRRGEKTLLPTGRPWLFAAAATGPASALSMMAGWEVTEGGRQPWIVGGHMRVHDAVTGADGVAPMFAGSLVLYLGLAGALILILRRMATGGPAVAEIRSGRPAAGVHRTAVHGAGQASPARPGRTTDSDSPSIPKPRPEPAAVEPAAVEPAVEPPVELPVELPVEPPVAGRRRTGGGPEGSRGSAHPGETTGTGSDGTTGFGGRGED